MPFDSTPAPITKQVDTSLNGLIRWLEQRPTDGRYSYVDIERCLLAQWLTHEVGRPVWGAHTMRTRDLSFQFEVGNIHDSTSFAAIAIDHPSTFGAALRRARRVERRLAGRTWIGDQVRALFARKLLADHGATVTVEFGEPS